ncbi:hypothetical protein VDGD_21752 [Verticillium dahliae]|nr:hypothetical protein VDGD_21752 [Verticillium dahliae]
MAMARPIRALVVVSVMLWCFFIYLILGPQKEIHLPERYSHERDPNLDREREPAMMSPSHDDDDDDAARRQADFSHLQ